MTSAPSFKDLQAKDEEEQKIQKKAKEIETAHKRAAEKVVVQSKGQVKFAISFKILKKNNSRAAGLALSAVVPKLPLSLFHP